MRKLKVLFLCTGNACRSVMGETILRHLAGNKFDVFVPDHFHVTEVGRVDKNFIDCGGTRRHATYPSRQA